MPNVCGLFILSLSLWSCELLMKVAAEHHYMRVQDTALDTWKQGICVGINTAVQQTVTPISTS